MPERVPPELRELIHASDAEAREDAWDRLVARFTPLLLHTARTFPGGHEAAMDRYAFILEQLRRDEFRRLHRYSEDGRASFATWLVSVARRLCADRHRLVYGRARGGAGSDSPARRARRSLADLVAEQLDAERHGPADPHDVQAELESGELRAALDRALAELAPADRLLLALRFEQDLSAREISELTRRGNTFQVYRQINALLKALAASLRRQGMEPPRQ